MVRASVELNLDSEVTKRLYNLSKERDVSPFTILLSTLNVLLYRYTNQDDCCMGKLVIPGDSGANEYITEMPFKTTITGEDLFIELVNRVNTIVNGVEGYEYCIFECNDNGLFIQNNIDVTQASQLSLVFQNKAMQGLEQSDFSRRTSKSELAFVIGESAAGINVVIEYDTAMYPKDIVNRIAGHFSQLLGVATATPDEKIGALPMLTAKEWNDVVIKFNDTLTPYPADKTLVQLFEEQVIKTPGNIALHQHGKNMTYAELNERANKLANYLCESSVKVGDNVGLLVSRGFDMIIGMYAILKAGGAYVPVDPAYPVDRQDYILSNSFARVIVCDDDYPLKSMLPSAQFINVNTLNLDNVGPGNPGLDISPRQLAYTIYTSGSTGRPKGVMIAHHSAVNLVTWVNKEFNIGGNDRLLFITSMCFDLSVYDIFGMLATGGSIVIVKQDELMDVQQLQDMLLRHKITFWDSVPTTMDYLVRELENSDKKYLQEALRIVFMSGDWIPVSLPTRIKKYFPNAHVISLGGATEGTVWSNFYPVNKVESHWSSIPYGRPMDNNFFYILNEQLQPAPIGVTGELYIGGVGVAEGYANDKEKTEYSFLKDPFNDQAGGRMYRTGDLGKMGPDLNMIFIGRKDTQVKINGFRIELGEIETAINQYELVRQCVVIAKADKDGNKRLISYIVGKQGYDRDRVIAHLKTRLPDYMVPTLWVEMDDLPITSNGKIDRRSLPEFNFEDTHKGKYSTAVTELEKELVKMWNAVLNTEGIGVKDNFFDMGGHSLLAVQIMTKVEKLTGKRLPISILFQYPTIEALSGYIEKDNTAKNNWKSLVQIKPSGSKMPFYIVHGIGLNVLNFKNLSLYVDADQPIFGFQAKGLDGIDAPLDDITEIAKWYVTEMITHNPTGPYAIGGYSIGGFIAVEMARQLELMNKEVKLLVIFDTDANYSKDGSRIMPQKINLPELIKLARLLYHYPMQTLHNIKRRFREPENPYDQLVLSLKSDSRNFYAHMKEIRVRLEDAFQRYQLARFNGSIYLFRASISIHFTQDKQYLGWRDYAKQGVKELEVPGDHSSIFNAKNAVVLGKLLQDALDNVGASLINII